MKRFGSIGGCALGLALFATSGLAQTSTITTYVGPPLPVSGFLATTQAMGHTSSVVPDRAGGFYFSSSEQNRIYRVTSAGSLTVIAGTGATGFAGDGGAAANAQLHSPEGIALDAAGNLFVADSRNHRLRKIAASGIITTVAGTGAGGFSGDGGLAMAAQLSSPEGVAVDAAGNLFVADSGNARIRRVTSAGLIMTIAGRGFGGGEIGDGGPATGALLSPGGVAVDTTGNLFIADRGSHRIRKVNPAGVITTVAGGGQPSPNLGDGGPATSARLNDPLAVAVDAAGNLLIADTGNERIRRVTPNGIITTFAGNGVPGFSGDSGPAIAAQLRSPRGVEADAAGNLLIAENGRIRKVTLDGTIDTVAGNGPTSGSSGEGGPATAARLDEPMGVAADPGGNLFIADVDNSRIRKVNPAGIITTVAGTGTSGFSGDGGPATAAQLGYPPRVAADSGGNLFIVDADNQRIRKVTPAGVITTVAGTGTSGFSGDGGPATAAQLADPVAVAVDAVGNLFIADNGNDRIRRVTPGGIITTVAGTETGGFGGDGGPATAAQLADPLAVAVDAAGNLFIADTGNDRIRKVTPSGIITTFAGSGLRGFSGDGGAATGAWLSEPSDVAVDAAGNFFIADNGNDRVRKVTPNGIITTVAGTGTGGFSGDGGPATAAQLNDPVAVAADAAGNLFIADKNNSRIRKVTFTGVEGLSISTLSALPAGTAGTAYSQTLAASGGTTPYSWSVTSGSLPPGLAFNTSTSTIRGTPAASGNYNFTITVTDSAAASASKVFTLTVLPQGSLPLTSLSPSSVLAAEPEFLLTVNGSGFQNGAVVYWNGSPRATTYVSSTQLQARIPTSDVLSPGPAQVTVVQSGMTSNALAFSITADTQQPVITRLLPPSGATLGNTRVTILGDHFRPELGTTAVINPLTAPPELQLEDEGPPVFKQVPGEGVFFGGVPVGQVVFVDRTRLEVTTPLNPAGNVDVRVVQSNGSATLPGGYAYKTLPPVPAVAVSSGGMPYNRLQIPFVVDNLDFRTNMGINNLSDSTATVNLLLVDPNGLLVTQKQTTVPARGMKQIGHVIRELEGAGDVTGREGYLIVESEQNIGAWASQIDNVSLDPSMEIGREERGATNRILLPSSVSTSRFLTSLIVINTSGTDGTVAIRAREVTGTLRLQVSSQPIAARGYFYFGDFYRAAGLSDVFGPIEIEGSSGLKLLATERIFTKEYTSAYLEGADLARAAKTLVLPYAVDTTDFRTNLGINNPGTTPANVTVSLVGKDGLVKGSLTETAAPNGLKQINDINRQLLGKGEVTGEEGTLRLESDQPIVAWTSQIDNLTQDPSLLVGKPSTATKLLIPSTTSAGNFKSTLAIVNLSSTPTSVQITARDNEGNIQATQSVTVPPQGLLSEADIRSSLNLAGTFGPLEIVSQDNKPLLAVSRVYSNQRTGGYFEGVPMSE